MWYMDGLVNHWVMYLASHWVILSKSFANSSVGLSAKGGVTPLDNNGSVIVKKN